MRTRMTWDDATLAQLRIMLAQTNPKLTYPEIGKHFGITRNAVAGAIHRLGDELRNPTRPLKPRKARSAQPPNHQGYFEKWVDFTARKKAERAAAKAALSELP